MIISFDFESLYIENLVKLYVDYKQLHIYKVRKKEKNGFITIETKDSICIDY